ncbi:MAG: GspH/FimT family protein [Cellvibrionaceae bacterium]|nr:GspH/FimT family protein [Cellvibrionaceae bacterium]
MARTPTGFTLTTLLITLSLAAILLGAGLPGLFTLRAHYQAETAYQRLMASVQFTRMQSVNHGSQAILCPTTNHSHCLADWNQTLMIFIDENRDEIRNSHEKLLRIIDLNDTANIHWRASGSRRYLRFQADGSTGNQNGRLSYCLQKGAQLYAKQIIMYRTGRARKANTHEAETACLNAAANTNSPIHQNH